MTHEDPMTDRSTIDSITDTTDAVVASLREHIEDLAVEVHEARRAFASASARALDLEAKVAKLEARIIVERTATAAPSDRASVPVLTAERLAEPLALGLSEALNILTTHDEQREAANAIMRRLGPVAPPGCEVLTEAMLRAAIAQDSGTDSGRVLAPVYLRHLTSRGPVAVPTKETP